MKRLYWTALAFFLPGYLVIVMLGAFVPALNSTVPSVSSAIFDLAPWLVFLFAVAAFLDWFFSAQGKNLITPMLAYFDRGANSLPPSAVSPQWEKATELRTRAIGTYHGRLSQIALHDSFSRNVRSYVSINLACRPPWQFQIRHRSIVLSMLEKFGEDHIQTGISELDRHYVFMSDAPEEFLHWFSRPEIREGIILLMSKYGMTSVGTPMVDLNSDLAASDMADPSIEARYYGYRMWNGSTVIANMPFVLEELQALANSLEKLTTSIVGEVAS